MNDIITLNVTNKQVNCEKKKFSINKFGRKFEEINIESINCQEKRTLDLSELDCEILHFPDYSNKITFIHPTVRKKMWYDGFKIQLETDKLLDCEELGIGRKKIKIDLNYLKNLKILECLYSDDLLNLNHTLDTVKVYGITDSNISTFIEKIKSKEIIISNSNCKNMVLDKISKSVEKIRLIKCPNISIKLENSNKIQGLTKIMAVNCRRFKLPENFFELAPNVNFQRMGSTPKF